MPEQSIRFAVRNASGHRAATWKVWTRAGGGKHDVYLACRSLGGTLKASLHDSGSWHIGFLRGFVDEEFDDADPRREKPYIDRWPRPRETAPGVTLAYRIVVPTASVTVPIVDSLPVSIVWIPAAPMGKAVEIDLVFTAQNSRVTNWPGRNAMRTELVGKLSLEDGETLWVVRHVVDVPDLPMRKGAVTWFRSGRDIGIADGNTRAIIFGSSDDGSRFMADCAVQRDALRLDNPPGET